MAEILIPLFFIGFILLFIGIIGYTSWTEEKGANERIDRNNSRITELISIYRTIENHFDNKQIEKREEARRLQVEAREERLRLEQERRQADIGRRQELMRVMGENGEFLQQAFSDAAGRGIGFNDTDARLDQIRRMIDNVSVDDIMRAANPNPNPLTLLGGAAARVQGVERFDMERNWDQMLNELPNYQDAYRPKRGLHIQNPNTRNHHAIDSLNKDALGGVHSLKYSFEKEILSKYNLKYVEITNATRVNNGYVFSSLSIEEKEELICQTQIYFMGEIPEFGLSYDELDSMIYNEDVI